MACITKSNALPKTLLSLLFMTLTAVTVFAEKKPSQTEDDSKTASEEVAEEQLIDAKTLTIEQNKIVQPFAWENAGDVSKYEIVIQKKNEKNGKYEDYYYHETNDEETESCIIYIDPPLEPGYYKSIIKVYNILDILEEDLTDIDEFIVYMAFKPEIKNATYPLYMRSTIYLDDLDNDGIIEIDGKNLFLPDPTGQELKSTFYGLKNEKRTIEPDELLEFDDHKNEKVKFRFDMKKLEVGKYHFYAQDASGLHSEANAGSEFNIKFKKWLDFDIEAGYTCPLILHDDTFPTYFGTMAYPLSAQFRLSLMPFKQRWGYLGLGTRVSFSRLDYEADRYRLDGNLLNLHALFIYQLPLFRRRAIFELHGGAGITYFNDIKYHFPHGIESKPLNTTSLSFDAGLAVQIYINKRLYVEVGGDYILALNSDMVLGSIQPSAGVGWQF